MTPVLIAGGGIGGLALALALARAGLASLVLERRQQWSAEGAGIQLSPNGVAILDMLGVADPLAAHAGVPEEIVVRSGENARVLQRLPLGSWLARRHGHPYWQVHRRDLQAALLEAARREPAITLALGRSGAGVSDLGDLVRVDLSDGDRLEGRLLIGADGAFSSVREAVFGGVPPRFSGRTAARTVVSTDEWAQLRDRQARSSIFSRDAAGVWLSSMGHAVHYPVSGGRELAVVVVRTQVRPEHGWSGEVPTGEVEQTLQAMAPALAAALAPPRDWRQWALFELDPLPAWARGRVALLGDAAHPTLPFMAQGGSLALEDAAVLAWELATMGTADRASEALLRYEQRRRSRADRVVAAARRNGRIFHLGGLAAHARNVVMRATPGTAVMAAYDWIYGWKPPAAETAGGRAAPKAVS